MAGWPPWPASPTIMCLKLFWDRDVYCWPGFSSWFSLKLVPRNNLWGGDVWRWPLGSQLTPPKMITMKQPLRQRCFSWTWIPKLTQPKMGTKLQPLRQDVCHWPEFPSWLGLKWVPRNNLVSKDDQLDTHYTIHCMMVDLKTLAYLHKASKHHGMKRGPLL